MSNNWKKKKHLLGGESEGRQWKQERKISICILVQVDHVVCVGRIYAHAVFEIRAGKLGSGSKLNIVEINCMFLWDKSPPIILKINWSADIVYVLHVNLILSKVNLISVKTVYSGVSESCSPTDIFFGKGKKVRLKQNLR